MALYHKYRPKSFDEIFGNGETVRALKGMLAQDDKPHSILFYGPSGCGKTTLARIVASELGCKGSDFTEVDTADFRGIDTIRDIRMKSQYKPLEGEVKVWLLDECHKLSNDAQNALLKILEDTPPHVYFILATTDPQKLIPTIKGRCAQFEVKPLSEKQMKRLLFKVVKSEKEHLERKVYDQIVRDSLGSPRNALQLLDKVLAVEPEYRLKVAEKEAEQQFKTIELCRALLQRKSWKFVSKILKSLQDEDPEGIRRAIMAYMGKILIDGENDLAALVMEEMMTSVYYNGFPGLIFACYSILHD
ncbi:MAG: DNA polymerase III subunit [Promethearchaeota archaeon]